MILPREAVSQNHLPEKTIASLNELGHELVICTAFYYISSIGIENRGTERDLKNAAQHKAVGDRALGLALILSEQIGQKPEAVQVRLDMAIADMRDKMADKFVNFSILLAKYSQPCVDLLNNVKARTAAAFEVER